MEPMGEDAVLGFESRDGPAEVQGEVERFCVWVRVVDAHEMEGSFVLLRRKAVVGRRACRVIVRDAIFKNWEL